MPIGTSSPKNVPEKLGLIAGMGGLPLALAAEAKKMGHYIVAIALQPPADESLKPLADEFHKISVGKFGGLLSLLKKHSISNVVMAPNAKEKDSGPGLAQLTTNCKAETYKFIEKVESAGKKKK